MKRKLSFLLACLLVFMAFVSCGKPEEQEPSMEPSVEPSPSPTPEVAMGILSDEEIAQMMERAKTTVLTNEDNEFGTETLVPMMLPVAMQIGTLETLLKDPKPEDEEWLASVKKCRDSMKIAVNAVAELTPTENYKDCFDIMVAGNAAMLCSAEKLALLPQDQEENLRLCRDYLDIGTQYYVDGQDYLAIVVESMTNG